MMLNELTTRGRLRGDCYGKLAQKITKETSKLLVSFVSDCRCPGKRLLSLIKCAVFTPIQETPKP